MNWRLVAICCAIPLSLIACRPQPGTAVVIRVIDGDTFEAFGERGRSRFRLRGIDSAEYRDNRCAAEAARQALVKMAAPGSIVRYTDHGMDRYDRHLVGLVSEDGGDLNAGLIRDGFAIAYRAEKETRDRYLALETNAKTEKRGLWDHRCGDFVAAFAAKGIFIRNGADGVAD